VKDKVVEAKETRVIYSIPIVVIVMTNVQYIGQTGRAFRARKKNENQV
jgi:hypothetical protein